MATIGGNQLVVGLITGLATLCLGRVLPRRIHRLGLPITARTAPGYHCTMGHRGPARGVVRDEPPGCLTSRMQVTARPGHVCGMLVVMDQPDEPQEETQEERAERSLQAIFSGADLTAESMQLANEFTDRHTGRLKSWMRRWTGGA